MSPGSHFGRKSAMMRREAPLKIFRYTGTALLAVALLSGCSKAPQAPPVSDHVRKALDEAGLKGISVSQDGDQGIVALSGHVATEAEKARAGRIAHSIATTQVVANEIDVLPKKSIQPRMDTDGHG